MAHMDQDYLYKVVTIGKSSVGKSSLISRFCKNEFNLCSRSTIGVEFSTRLVKLEDGRVARMQIWDTAGQEQFRAITQSFYRNARAALLVYDISELSSFHDLQYWAQEVRQFAPPNTPLILVGNKSDRTFCRKVSHEDGLEKAAEMEAFDFIETSALDNTNVVDLFERVAAEIHRRDLPCRSGVALSGDVVRLSPPDADLEPPRAGCCR